jgi:hypothetical protein
LTGFLGFFPGFPDESLEIPIAFGDRMELKKAKIGYPGLTKPSKI